MDVDVGTNVVWTLAVVVANLVIVPVGVTLLDGRPDSGVQIGQLADGKVQP